MGPGEPPSFDGLRIRARDLPSFDGFDKEAHVERRGAASSEARKKERGLSEDYERATVASSPIVGFAPIPTPIPPAGCFPSSSSSSADDGQSTV